jgi:hypothetical protein
MDQDKKQREEHKLSLSAKIASITTLIAVIGLITAVVNNGGLNLLKAIWQPLAEDKKLASAPVSTLTSNPATSTPEVNTSADSASITAPVTSNTPGTLLTSPATVPASGSLSTTPLPTNDPNTVGLLKNITETECQSATPGRNLDRILQIQKQEKFSLTLGREVLPLLASVEDGNYGNNQIYRKTPIEFVCNLNSSYKQLKLVYGVHGANQLATPDNKIIFTMFLDGKPAGVRQVVAGSKQELILNLQGVKNVAFRAECAVENCPSLSFAEMSLY